MSGALRFILIASIPAAVGLIFAGQPLIGLLERGAFDASASDLVYSTLRFFALGLIVHSSLEVVARSFYADQDTLTPLFAALGGAAINFAGSIVFSNVYAAEANRFYNLVAFQFPSLGFVPIGNVSGLALANSLGVAFEVITLLWVLRRRWQGVNENALARTTLKTLAASLVMALAIVLIESAWTRFGLAERGFIYLVAQVIVEVSGGALVFFAVAMLLRMEELKAITGLILRRDRAAVESIVS